MFRARMRSASVVAALGVAALGAGMPEAGAQGAGAPGAGAEPRLLGTYKDWRTYERTGDDGKICFALSQPTRSSPGNVRRGEIFFIVTHRSTGKVYNEVSMRVGYAFSRDSEPFVRIGTQTFPMHTGVQEGDERAYWAWVRDVDTEERLVQAMKRGRTMVLKGTSSRGTLTTDQYSLLGISAALRAIDKACP